MGEVRGDGGVSFRHFSMLNLFIYCINLLFKSSSFLSK